MTDEQSGFTYGDVRGLIDAHVEAEKQRLLDLSEADRLIAEVEALLVEPTVGESQVRIASRQLRGAVVDASGPGVDPAPREEVGEMIKISDRLFAQLDDVFGIDHRRVRRIVIDLRANEMPVVHIEQYGDERILDVVRELGGVRIDRVEVPITDAQAGHGRWGDGGGGGSGV